MKTKDNRSKEIKAVLKANFPNHKHTCKINKFASGEAIYVATSYIPNWKDENFDNAKVGENKKDIEKLLKDYKDDCNGCGGGNTYIYVDSL